MKKNFIVFIFALLVIAGYLIYTSLATGSMQVTNTLEESSFSIEMPKAFEYETDKVYYNEKKDMFVEWRHYPKEMGLDAEAFLHIVSTNEFYEDDILDIDDIEINGEDAWLCEYRTLTTANDGIHYYFTGLMTVFELDEEFLLVDVYQSMTEAEGINSTILDSDMQLLKDITYTIDITDDDYENVVAFSKDLKGDELSFELTDFWEPSTEDENGMYDYGHYASYRYENLPLWIDIEEYNDQNIADMSYVKETMDSYDFYTYQGEGNIGGEFAYIYSYDAYSSDGSAPFVYGVIGVSEHYLVDIYFYAYDESYEISQDFIDAAYDVMVSAN